MKTRLRGIRSSIKREDTSLTGSHTRLPLEFKPYHRERADDGRPLTEKPTVRDACRQTGDRTLTQKPAKRFRLLRNAIKWLAIRLLPLLYNSYMWFVYHTSRKTEIRFSNLWEMTGRGENLLGAIWHQDLFISPYCHRGHNLHAMVSYSSWGNIAAEILRKCGVTAVRGGRARGGREALAEIAGYMNTHRGVLCAITVDGSRGPARKVQSGIFYIARETGAPIYPARSWARRTLLVPTWDRTMVPLPFNHLVFMVGEPIRIPQNAAAAMIEISRNELERRLNELAEHAEHFFQNGAATLPTDTPRT